MKQNKEKSMEQLRSAFKVLDEVFRNEDICLSDYMPACSNSFKTCYGLALREQLYTALDKLGIDCKDELRKVYSETIVISMDEIGDSGADKLNVIRDLDEAKECISNLERLISSEKDEIKEK